MQTVNEGGQLRTRLETWGEVATYLGIEVRTAQRWERKLGLPVRRLIGSQAVYAFANELDAWRAAREMKNEEALVAVTPQPAPPGTSRQVVDRSRWLLWATAAVSVFTVIGAFSGGQRRLLEPTMLALQGSKLLALDPTGATVWTHDFGETPEPFHIGHRTPLEHWWRRIDVDGDGTDELIAIAGLRRGSPVARERLYCFELDGRLQYSYEPALSLRFEQREFSSSWIFMDAETVRGDRALWVALASEPWWPSAVVRIDAAGHGTTRFTQPGNIRVLTSFNSASGPRLIAGGVNNEYAAASLALLDPFGTPSSAPMSGNGPYHCLNCPSDTPIKYVQLQPTPLSKADGVPYNRVDGVLARERIEVLTYEGGSSAGVEYEFDHELNALAIRPTDSYRISVPKQLEADAWRLMMQTVQPVEVRAWSAGSWKKASLPLDAR